MAAVERRNRQNVHHELTSALKAYAEKPVELTVVRDGNEVRLSATPSADGTLGFNLTQLTDIYPVTSPSSRPFGKAATAPENTHG